VSNFCFGNFFEKFLVLETFLKSLKDRRFWDSEIPNDDPIAESSRGIPVGNVQLARNSQQGVAAAVWKLFESFKSMLYLLCGVPIRLERWGV